MTNPTQDSQSELEELLVNHYYDYKDAMYMQGGDGDIKKAIAVTVKYRQVIEAYVTTRVKEVLGRLEDSCEFCTNGMATAYESGDKYADHEDYPCEEDIHDFAKKELEALTTTTNGKGE
jgi:hypothetical protein